MVLQDYEYSVYARALQATYIHIAAQMFTTRVQGPELLASLQCPLMRILTQAHWRHVRARPGAAGGPAMPLSRTLRTMHSQHRGAMRLA